MALQNLLILATLMATMGHMAASQAATAALTIEEANPAAASSSNSSSAATTASKPAAATTAATTTSATVTTTAAPSSAATTTPPSGGLDNNTTAVEDQVAVLTFLGVVNGKMVTSPTGKTHFRFQGIPYAQPPVGSLRFLEPLPAAAWANLDAFELKSPCAQLTVLGPAAGSFVGSEDCLYLNIYTPALPTAAVGNGGGLPDRSALKPVMVWIHGGGFVEGSGGQYYPRGLVEKEVVVVTLNYRLASLGFLSFGNTVVSGNMGLRDQLEALRWVQRYIHNFGGDPDRVTLFGESAGGVSVSALYLSPLSAGLFSAAISQSGTMLMTKNTNDRPRQERTARAVANHFGCERADLDHTALACLQQIPVEDLLRNISRRAGDSTSERSPSGPGSWWPIVDSHAPAPVLPLEPLHALRVGAFRQVPLMTGTVKNEGAIMALLSLGKTSLELEQLWNRTGPLQLQVTRSDNWTAEEGAVANIARQYYTRGDNISLQSGSGWVDLLTDSMFLSPDQKTAQLIGRRVANVYNYRLTFADRFSFARLFGAPDNTWAPVHGDDLGYLMELTLFNTSLSAVEQQLADKMTSYWTNFAKYGNPSPFVSEDLPLWLPYADKRHYMELKPEPEMRNNVEPERMMFWQRLFWDPRESELERLSLYQRLANFFLTAQQPANDPIAA